MALSKAYRHKTSVTLTSGKVWFLYDSPSITSTDSSAEQFAAGTTVFNDAIDNPDTTTLGYNGESMHHRIFVYSRGSTDKVVIWASAVDSEVHFVELHVMDVAASDEIVVTGSGMQLPYRYVAIENVSGSSVKIDVESWGSHIR
jgi:hypothetical protein